VVKTFCRCFFEKGNSRKSQSFTHFRKRKSGFRAFEKSRSESRLHAPKRRALPTAPHPEVVKTNCVIYYSRFLIKSQQFDKRISRIWIGGSLPLSFLLPKSSIALFLRAYNAQSDCGAIVVRFALGRVQADLIHDLLRGKLFRFGKERRQPFAVFVTL